MEERKANEFKLPEVCVRLAEGSLYLTSKEPIRSPESAVRIVSEHFRDMDREYVCMVSLAADGSPVNYNIVSIGNVNSACVAVGNIFKVALLSNAASVILLHNHTGGGLKPSKEDMQMTWRIRDAGNLLGIPLVEHIIMIPRGDYYSMKEHGLI